MNSESAAVTAVRKAVASALAPVVDEARAAGRVPCIAIAFSGGRDSTVLLDTLALLAPAMGFSLVAIHVHHGLSSHADAWAAACAARCAARGIPLTVERIGIVRAPGQSLEAAARAARYRALAVGAADAAAIALAHHADDQAETLLLQLLRGAGPRGLAAMPIERMPVEGPRLVRPLLSLPGATIEACGVARGLAWIDDESNADTRLKRNLLRHEIAPRLAAAFPGYPLTLVRSAALQAEAASLADELAALDATGALGCDEASDPTLDRAALSRLTTPRARNLLRWFLHRHDLPAPSAARLDAMLAQLADAKPDARVRLRHGDVEIGVHRGRIVVHAPSAAAFDVAWQGEATIVLPHGTLAFLPTTGHGIAAATLAGATVRLRSRSGGERLRLGPRRPRCSVTNLMQQAGIPWWARTSLPFVWCGDRLAGIPGVGVDAAFQAGAGVPGLELCWQPREGAHPGFDGGDPKA
jgi:tRNA(Ile)-lysidine synthase